MKHPSILGALSAALLLSTTSAGQQAQEPVIQLGDQSFATWHDYLDSQAFQAYGLRCGTPDLAPPEGLDMGPGDCTGGSTTILPQYSPSNGLFRIPVVVHILENTSGSGKISNAKVQSQIDILNEDFKALPGTNGAPGTNVSLEFYLATIDPNGNPTNGITRSVNNNWHNDSGQYWNTLAWDTNRYLNIYTNRAGGALGYVPGLPQNGIVGSKSDRIVILWSSFGRNGPIGPPYNQGRTTTHEVGHYLGLYHTFQGGCASVSNCYGNGDRICDTNAETTSRFGCPNATSCGTPDPVRNYMDYTDDLCMNNFTPEQANRMRCTLENYRPNLPQAPSCVAANVLKRNQAPNLDVFTATSPVIGQPVTFTVDTQGFQFATIYGFGAPAQWLHETGYWVFMSLESPRAFILGPLPGPTATTQQVVANDPSMCGLTIYTQAKLHNLTSGFAASNSQDLVIGL